jgi:hypothetical protein
VFAGPGGTHVLVHGPHSDQSLYMHWFGQANVLHGTVRSRDPHASSASFALQSAPPFCLHATVRVSRRVPPLQFALHGPASVHELTVHVGAHEPRLHGTTRRVMLRSSQTVPSTYTRRVSTIVPLPQSALHFPIGFHSDIRHTWSHGPLSHSFA